MRTVTHEEVVRTLRQIARDSGDTVSSCYYTYEDADKNICHCIVGETLTRLEVWCPGLGETGNEGTSAARIAHVAKLSGKWKAEPKAVGLFATVQGFADEGFSWATAVQKAQDLGHMLPLAGRGR